MKIIKITCCTECPYFNGRYTCLKLKKGILDNVLSEDRTPSWCSLPDIMEGNDE